MISYPTLPPGLPGAVFSTCLSASLCPCSAPTLSAESTVWTGSTVGPWLCPCQGHRASIRLIPPHSREQRHRGELTPLVLVLCWAADLDVPCKLHTPSPCKFNLPILSILREVGCAALPLLCQWQSAPADVQIPLAGYPACPRLAFLYQDSYFGLFLYLLVPSQQRKQKRAQLPVANK